VASTTLEASAEELRGPRAGASPGRLGSYVIVTYAISWAIWAPLTSGRPHGAWKYLHLVGALGPAVGGVVATAREGRGALRTLRDRFRARAPMVWMMAAVLGPLGLFVLSTLALRLAGHPWPSWRDVGASREYAELPRGVYWLANIAFYGFGEEIGWRGYLLPRLQRRLSPLLASACVAAVWSLWHLPLFWFAAGLSAMGPAAIAGWAASMFTGSLLMTYLWKLSRGSILVVALFHGVLDIVMTTPGSMASVNVMGAVLTIVGLLCMLPLRAGKRPAGA
jgi:membrane protease YdiL (CAAX protease family)